MKTKKIVADNHVWHFVQVGGLMQLQIRNIDDVLNLSKLDQKLWVALSCPVSGLEMDEETLKALDLDHNGRVRVPEILSAVDYIKKYFSRPEVIMEAGDSIPLDAMSDEPFDCGHSPKSSASAVLGILGKGENTSLTLSDLAADDRLFSPSVLNGDKVLPKEAVKDENAASVVSDIIAATEGADDISGVKGITREQFTAFFADLRAIHEWRAEAGKDSSDVFFLKLATDSAASSYMAVKDKINEYFLRCSLDSYSSDLSKNLHEKDLGLIDESLDVEKLSLLPLAENKDGLLPLTQGINPAWAEKIAAFKKCTVDAFYGEDKIALSESEWKKLEADFAPYMTWYASRPENSASGLSIERVDEILASDSEQIIDHLLTEEEKQPPIALATKDLKKMLLLRRDFVRLLKNYVSFEEFYNPETPAVFQCGTLYIDGLSLDLCFRVVDEAKHSSMSPLSQCFLLYCNCVKQGTGEKMQIAAVVSSGNRENLIVGRNGLFYDRDGKDWDATITKIVENPISIKEAFWSPYKKVVHLVQDKITKAATDAESKVSEKMSAAVEKPTEAATNAAASSKKIDVGTIAAISVAFTGIATVVGGLLQAFFGLGAWIPLGIVGIILLISLPSMFIAWTKLRQRNIAPILDASGWAVNGNVKINIKLGSVLSHSAVRPKNSTLDLKDPFAQKKFPVKRVILLLVLIALIVLALVLVIKNEHGVSGVWQDIKNLLGKFIVKKAVS